MSRKRMTWEDEARRASAHPATPDEGPASPAHTQDDPDASQYENGDTSSWAEDVHPGPYPNGAHPAYPDEGPASPAYKAAMERKAAKCIRIASHMLGEDAKVAAIEDQALALMDLSDEAITASLVRLGEEVEEEVEEETEEAKKKASAKIASLEDRVARLERVLIRLAEEEDDSDDDDSDDDDSDDDVEEAKKKASYMTEEAMFEAMLDEEGMGDPMAEESCGGMGGEMMEEDVDEMEFDLGGDPMGVLASEMSAEEASALSELFGKSASDDEEEEEIEIEESKKKASEEEEEEVEVEEEAKKKASLRPQPKKASAGARKLGGVSKEASSDDPLASLWESSPDVSKYF